MTWPRVEAHGNDNGDWKVSVENGGPVIVDLSTGAGQHARLVEALRLLVDALCEHPYGFSEDATGEVTCSECSVVAVDVPEKQAVKLNALRATVKARAVLASDSGHGCTETDSATQERNAKRIAAGLTHFKPLIENLHATRDFLCGRSCPHPASATSDSPEDHSPACRAASEVLRCAIADMHDAEDAG